MIKLQSHLTDYRFLLIFLVIFVSSETVLFGTNANEIYLQLKRIFVNLLFPISYFLLYKEKKSFSLPSSMIVALAFFALFLLFSSVYNGFTIGYVSRFTLILTGFNIAYLIKRDLFWNLFEKIIFCIACYSVFVYAINFASPQIIRAFPVIDNTGNFSFYNLLLCNIPVLSFYSIRLFGPFREPGVFQMFLTMALMIHWLQSKPIKKIRSFIYFVAIFLTFSTTGYIAFALLIVAYRFSRSKVGFKDHAFYILLFFLLLVIYLYTDVLSYEGIVFGKLNEENASSTARFGSIMGNLHIFSSSPFWGVGILSLENLFNSYIYQNYLAFSTSNTNTVLIQFSTFGVFYGLLWCYGFCQFWWKLSEVFMASSLYIVLGLILFSGENLTETVLTYIIIGYGFLNSEHAVTKV